MQNKSTVKNEMKQAAFALWTAAKNSEEKKALQLLKKKAYINVNAEWQGTNILWLAASNGMSDLITQLILRGALVNISSQDCTPLFIAVKNNHMQCVVALLRGGANPNIIHAREIISPLYQAVLDNRYLIVKLLIEAGSLLDTRNAPPLNITPLCAAISNKNLALVRALIHAGSGVNAVNLDTETPLSYAKKFFPEIVEELIASGAIHPVNMTHQYIERTIIRNPKSWTTYHLKLPYSNQPEILVSLYGDNFDNISSLDLESGLFIYKNTNNGTFGSFNIKNLSFITKDLLPTSYRKPVPPIIMRSTDYKLNYLLKIQKLTLFFNKNNTACKLECDSDIEPFSTDNSVITKQYQSLIPGIPLLSGNYPILIPEKRPNAYAIHKIYQNFMRYNNFNRLEAQSQVTEHYCHLRAHFMNLLLAEYGIESMKVFKIWDTSQWNVFPSHARWKFHCGVMIIDNKNKEHILEPWKSFSTIPLSINQWAYFPNIPVPQELRIMSRGVISQYKEGEVLDGVNMIQNNPGPYLNLLQCMIQLAIPNRPQYSLSNETYRFFKSNSKNKDTNHREEFVDTLSGKTSKLR